MNVELKTKEDHSTFNIKNSKLTFGPIPSRRFGISLGIDLSPSSKQCNFDCLYCELTPAKTTSTQINSPLVNDIITQLKQSISKHSNIDVITVTANGEPTLYPYLDELIDEIDKIKGKSKTLILSNGSTIYKKKIQQILSKIDIVKLSLDCVSEKCFKSLDRSDNSVPIKNIVDGMIQFRKLYEKSLILEILFVKTINDKQSEIDLLYDAVQKINPNRIDIGTIDRPPAYDVKPLCYEELLDIVDSFSPLPVNLTYKSRPKSLQSYSEDEITALLKRRPLTLEDIENTFDNNSKTILQKLLSKSIIKKVDSSGVQFYKFA